MATTAALTEEAKMMRIYAPLPKDNRITLSSPDSVTVGWKISLSGVTGVAYLTLGFLLGGLVNELGVRLRRLFGLSRLSDLSFSVYGWSQLD